MQYGKLLPIISAMCTDLERQVTYLKSQGNSTGNAKDLVFDPHAHLDPNRTVWVESGYVRDQNGDIRVIRYEKLVNFSAGKIGEFLRCLFRLMPKRTTENLPDGSLQAINPERDLWAWRARRPHERTGEGVRDLQAEKFRAEIYQLKELHMIVLQQRATFEEMFTLTEEATIILRATKYVMEMLNWGDEHFIETYQRMARVVTYYNEHVTP